MKKPLVVVSHSLEDHAIASRFASVLHAHTNTAFDIALSALGTLLFPQRPVAGRDLRASDKIALHILICSEVALESALACGRRRLFQGEGDSYGYSASA